MGQRSAAVKAAPLLRVSQALLDAEPASLALAAVGALRDFQVRLATYLFIDLFGGRVLGSLELVWQVIRTRVAALRLILKQGEQGHVQEQQGAEHPEEDLGEFLDQQQQGTVLDQRRRCCGRVGSGCSGCSVRGPMGGSSARGCRGGSAAGARRRCSGARSSAAGSGGSGGRGA